MQSEILSLTPTLAVRAGEKVWSGVPGYRCRITAPGGVTAYFDEAKCTVSLYETGFGRGFRAVYEDFSGLGALRLECRAWVEATTGDAVFELVPLTDGEIDEIFWPAPFAHTSPEGYSVLPLLHGCILQNYTQETLPRRWPETSWYKEDGYYSCTRSMFMQFLSQYEPDGGYISIFETRWDAGMEPDCGGGRPVVLAPLWRESLGTIRYPRRLRVKLLPAGCDYNDVCAAYRGYIDSIGELRTLEEKAADNPALRSLIGSPVIHTHIWHHFQPDSSRYEPGNPEHNDRKQSFAFVAQSLGELRKRGLTHGAVHLDGWGRRGYDNQHPDIFPPVQELGGWDGLRQAVSAAHEAGYLFGLHDQYRDYYLDADTYDRSLSMMARDGSVPGHAMWEGGRQTLLCSAFAPWYVRRNYDTLAKEGIGLDFTYLDVFSSVVLDECYDPSHPMTREDCARARARAFRDVASRGILCQSEDAIDWALPCLSFVHHAPFAYHEDYAGEHYVGIPVPLLSLVYHDCVILPWIPSFNRDALLWGVLTGSATYVPLDAGEGFIRRAELLSVWQKTVQTRRLLRHTLLDARGRRQRTEFEGGYTAEIDLDSGLWHISGPGLDESGSADETL